MTYTVYISTSKISYYVIKICLKTDYNLCYWLTGHVTLNQGCGVELYLPAIYIYRFYTK